MGLLARAHEGPTMLLPFDSVLFGDMVGTPAMREVWTDHVVVEKWIAVERAITEAQAELGLIPTEAAAAIARSLTAETLGPQRIAEKKGTVGHLMVAFLKAFRDAAGEAGEHLHVGPTTQDILDTALVLQMRDADRIVDDRARRLEALLCEQALAHTDTAMMGRTHQQHAVPVTLGLILVGWAAAVADHVDRAAEARPRWQVGNLSGAAGANNAMVELGGAGAAAEVQRRLCARLELGVPIVNQHPRVDRFAEVVIHLSELTGTLGRIGLDIRGLQRTEVGELAEPSDDQRHWSSTMPNKRNPEACEQVEGLAAVCRGLALALQEVRMADNRDATRLPVELVAIPQAYLATDRALETLGTVIAGLEVDAERMRANIDHPSGLGLAAAERVMVALYRRTGLRDRFHGVLHECSLEARRRKLPLLRVLQEDARITEHLGADELARLFDLTSYLGNASEQTAACVAAIRRRRSAA